MCPSKDNYTCVSSRGKSVVDYIWVPQDNYVQCVDFCVDLCSDLIERYNLENYISEKSKVPDHSILSLIFNVDQLYDHTTSTSMDYNSQDVNSGTKIFKTKRLPDDFLESDLAKLAIQSLINDIEQWRESQEEVDIVYDKFLKCMNDEMESRLPSFFSGKSRKYYRNHKPFWNNELQSLWSDMHNKEKNFVKFKGCHRMKQQLLAQYKDACKIFQKKLRYSERMYNREKLNVIERLNTNNPTEFWDHINKLGPRIRKDIPLEVYNQDGDVCNDVDTVLRKWKSEYSNLLINNGDPEFDEQFYRQCIVDKDVLEFNMSKEDYLSNIVLNRTIEMSELIKVLSKVKSGKAMGIDKIPNEVLKVDGLRALLLELFNLFFVKHIIPSLWLKSIIKPIPKSSNYDPRIPLNYRGISLLSTVSKVYTAILNNRIMSYVEAQGLIYDEQNGFREGRSCQDHIFSLTSIIRNRMNNNMDTYAAFIDLRKAFDFVNRDLLLYKLLKYNIDGNMYFAIKQLYSNTKSCVQLNQFRTEWFETTSGVRQGDTLSPTLFTLFLNDVIGEINDLKCGVNIGDFQITCLAYADDIVLLSETEEGLQKLLTHFHKWCCKWRLSINAQKSQIMHFRKSRKNVTKFVFKIGKEVLKITDKYKYLGVVLHENLNFSCTTEVLANSAGRAFGSIMSKFKQMKNMGFSTYTTLFENCVDPVLYYAAGIWGTKCYKKVEDIQLRAIRFFLGVHKFTSLLALQGDMGWIPPKVKGFVNTIYLWNRLITMNDSRLTKRVFKWDFDINKDNWSNDVRKILTSVEMKDVFDNMEVCNTHNIREKLVTIEKQSWKNNIVNMPKLRTYNLFKESYVTEKYVSMNLDRNERSLMAQVRMGILPIRIEVGRYRKEPVEERICQICNQNVIEDEMHFLFYCQAYDNIRESFFEIVNNEYFESVDMKGKLKYLFENKPRQTAKYIVKLYEHRKMLLYK